MTLVVTEVSEQFGCIVVGDTAVTLGGNRVILGAEKVHYSHDASIGFALWGNACLDGRRIDELVADFVEGLTNTASPRSAGRDLAAFLTREGERDGRPWNALRGGVHVCGYQENVPVLFHVHTGHEGPPQRPFELYEDVPDASGGAHLRNGFYQIFATLFEAMEQYAHGLGQQGFRWPYESVDDRVSYYSIMVETVARTLEAAGRVPKVGPVVSALAFNRNGMQVDKRLRRSGTFCQGDTASASFSGI